MSQATRRLILQGAGIAAAALAAPTFIRSASATSKVRVASLLALSGPFAGIGKPAEPAVRLAFTAGAREFGVDAELMMIDGEGNPGRALPKIIAAANDGVRLFSGAVISTVGLALSAEAEKAGGLYVASIGADEVTGSQCRRSTFRWPVPSYGAIQQTVRPMIEAHPQAKRWYTITPKYVFGETLLKHAKDIFSEKGIEHVGNSFHSLTENEFSSHVANIAAAKPDVLLMLNFGNQANNTLRQMAAFGLKPRMKILMAWATGLEQYQEIGSDTLEGVYLGCQYDHAIDAPGNRRIVELFKRELGVVPSYTMVNGYIVNELIFRGIKAAGSSEPQAVIKALEGLEYDGPTGTEMVQAFDHQVAKAYFLLKGKSKAAKRFEEDYVDIVSSGRSFLGPEQSECKMPPRI